MAGVPELDVPDLGGSVPDEPELELSVLEPPPVVAVPELDVGAVCPPQAVARSVEVAKVPKMRRRKVETSMTRA